MANWIHGFQFFYSIRPAAYLFHDNFVRANIETSVGQRVISDAMAIERRAPYDTWTCLYAIADNEKTG
nr:hypothetical protein [Azorhizobium doebereinerae]